MIFNVRNANLFYARYRIICNDKFQYGVELKIVDPKKVMVIINRPQIDEAEVKQWIESCIREHEQHII